MFKSNHWVFAGSLSKLCCVLAGFAGCLSLSILFIIYYLFMHIARVGCWNNELNIKFHVVGYLSIYLSIHLSIHIYIYICANTICIHIHTDSWILKSWVQFHVATDSTSGKCWYLAPFLAHQGKHTAALRHLCCLRCQVPDSRQSEPRWVWLDGHPYARHMEPSRWSPATL